MALSLCVCGDDTTAVGCFDPAAAEGDPGNECFNSCTGGSGEDPDCMECVMNQCGVEISNCSTM